MKIKEEDYGINVKEFELKYNQWLRKRGFPQDGWGRGGYRIFAGKRRNDVAKQSEEGRGG